MPRPSAEGAPSAKIKLSLLVSLLVSFLLVELLIVELLTVALLTLPIVVGLSFVAEGTAHRAITNRVPLPPPSTPMRYLHVGEFIS
jgi:hypothetical protein